MKKIAILTDSSCDLTPEQLRENNIFLLPLKIIYKDREYNDKIDITIDDVYKNMENHEIPTTSLATPQYINTILDEIKIEGYTHVIGIFISAALSGTFNAARLAISEHHDLEYYLYDTKIIGYPLGTIVLEAKKLVDQEKSFEEVIEALPSIRQAVTGYYTLNTLEYLKRGGRIGKIAGTLGELLHLKPIISVNDEGSYISIEKCRGRKQSLKKLKDLILEHLSMDKCKVSMLQGMSYAEAKEIADSLESHPNLISIDIRDIGAAMAVHAGPGMVGVSIFKES